MGSWGMFSGNYQWGLGLLVGLPTSALIVGVLLEVARAAFKLYRKDPAPDPGFRRVGRVALGGALLTLAITAFAWYPFTPMREFHAYSEVLGVVRGISTRLITTDDGDVEQRIVINLDAGLFGCDDSRCGSLETGDSVRLLCKKDYQWVGTPGWLCKWEDE